MVSHDTFPTAKPQQLSPTLTIHAPLTHRGHGPGIVVVIDEATSHSFTNGEANTHQTLDPEPLQKWAEEGYVVAELHLTATDDAPRLRDELRAATEALTKHDKCSSKSRYAAIVYTPAAFPSINEAIDGNGDIVAVVSFSALPTACRKPRLYHLAEKPNPLAAAKTPAVENETVHRYGNVKSANFVLPGHADFVATAAAVSHSRSVAFIKKHLDGPWFDLEAIWDEHTAFEFETRNVEDTMATMVAEPYVNHVPTLTGGVGRAKLSVFYRDHFIHSNPDGTELELISRTVGVDRIVDEFLFCCKHDRVIDWLLPGVPPTGKDLKIPFNAVVNIRGDRLFHEHIAWDQLTVLFQLGLMPEYLPFPYPVDGVSDSSKKIEYRVPGTGIETARKLADETSVPSNEMFNFTHREV
ncbi:carboxymethylenebutenolidase [Microdochium bolleyi]|uniref:Carboxymethylenebutenolidase n=1 Tax=Microdochium bolleyi TaxID=196109 RepID=A0A136JA62_9PEZI|nr:carboxymethylenebutenolidase [Microdochium bolleyi]